MTGPLKHKTSHPQVDVQVAGGDDTKTARRGAIFIGLVLIAYIVYLVVTGQMAQFWGAMASVKGGWLSRCLLLHVLVPGFRYPCLRNCRVA